MNEFLSKFKPFYPVVLLAFAISNIFVSCQLVRENSPREIVRTFVITNVLDNVSFSSNVSAAVSSPVINPTNSVLPFIPRSVATTSYQYFLSGGRIGCKMYGRFYYEGSPCSYGKIRSIYPDRVILLDGNWIENSQDFANGVLIVDSSKPQRRLGND